MNRATTAPARARWNAALKAVRGVLLDSPAFALCSAVLALGWLAQRVVFSVCALAVGAPGATRSFDRDSLDVDPSARTRWSGAGGVALVGRSGQHRCVRAESRPEVRDCPRSRRACVAWPRGRAPVARGCRLRRSTNGRGQFVREHFSGRARGRCGKLRRWLETGARSHLVRCNGLGVGGDRCGPFWLDQRR